MGALHSVSVSAVITNDDGDVLLIRRRDNGHWEPPGGVLELQESILDGLRREVLEETGFNIEPGRLTGVYKNMDRGVVALVFTARRLAGASNPVTDETIDLAWVDPSRITDMCDEAYSIRIADALANLQPAVRIHDGIRLLSQDGDMPASTTTRLTNWAWQPTD